MKLTHEVVIVGAGPVGLALANCLALAPSVHSVALVDRKLPFIEQPLLVPHNIAYSINKPSLQIIKGLNAQILRYGSLQSIQVYSDHTHVSWAEHHAQIVQSKELTRSLLTALLQKNSSKVELIEDQIQQIDNERYTSTSVRLRNRVLTTKLLVGSDGGNSKVKEMSNIATYGWNYRQKAIVCTLTKEEGNEVMGNRGYQYYYEGNTLALLPLWDQYVSLVWSVELPLFEHYMRMSEEQFVQELNAVMRWQSDPPFRIGSLANQRMGFPLKSLQASQYCGHRVALIGDSAHSIHPMAGLGVNAGLLDCAFLANNIIRNIATGNDIGDQIALSEFQSKAKALNYAQALAMEAINEGFKWKAVSPLRKIVLGALNNVDLSQIVSNNPLARIDKCLWL